MGTTPNYALPYPNETDDADVPVDMGELATAIDNILLGRTIVDAKGDILAASAPDTVARVPVGTNGQVLSADSASSAGLKWIPLAGAYVPVTDKGAANGVATLDATGKVPTAQLPPGGGVGTIFDAKGDILVAAANDDPRRLAAGADGQVLTADAAQALGLKWATPAAGGGGGGGPVGTPELSYTEYAQTTVTATTEAAANVVVTAPALTFDGATPILVTFYSPFVRNPSAGGTTQIVLFDGATPIGIMTQVWNSAAQSDVALHAVRRLTPSAGSHTYSARAFVTGSGSGQIFSNVGGAGLPVPGFLRITPANVVGTPVVGVGTTLPASPYDGQEYVLVDSLTAPTYQWRFRYTASITDAYKWMFVGGAPAYTAVETDESFSTVGTSDLPTVGPQITIPRLGDYWVDATADGYHAVAGGVFNWQVTPTAIAAFLKSITANDATTVGVFQKLNLAAGTLLKMVYQNGTAGAAHYRKRRLGITPIRVA